MHAILVSGRKEPVPWGNAELLVVHGDAELADAVRKEKKTYGRSGLIRARYRPAR